MPWAAAALRNPAGECRHLPGAGFQGVFALIRCKPPVFRLHAPLKSPDNLVPNDLVEVPNEVVAAKSLDNLVPSFDDLVKSLDDLVKSFAEVLRNEVIAAFWCINGAKSMQVKPKRCNNLVPSLLVEARNEVLVTANRREHCRSRIGRLRESGHSARSLRLCRRAGRSQPGARRGRCRALRNGQAGGMNCTYHTADRWHSVPVRGKVDFSGAGVGKGIGKFVKSMA